MASAFDHRLWLQKVLQKPVFTASVSGYLCQIVSGSFQFSFDDLLSTTGSSIVAKSFFEVHYDGAHHRKPSTARTELARKSFHRNDAQFETARRCAGWPRFSMALSPSAVRSLWSTAVKTN